MREDFGRHVGYLPQAVELFDGTVFRNIARMGEARPEAVFAAAPACGMPRDDNAVAAGL